jgi:hypothetical protein
MINGILIVYGLSLILVFMIPFMAKSLKLTDEDVDSPHQSFQPYEKPKSE